MSKDKLQVKDLINTGIFTAINFILMFAVGMVVGLVPILYLFLPLVIAVVCGTVYMLFLTKVRKKGMIFLMALITSLLMFLQGHMLPGFIIGILTGIIADFISSIGDYKSFKFNTIGYCIFSLWPVGAFVPIWIMRETYFDTITKGMGIEYAESLQAITPMWVLPLMAIATMVAGVGGAYLGKKLLKKHFIKAGIA